MYRTCGGQIILLATLYATNWLMLLKKKVRPLFMFYEYFRQQLEVCSYYPARYTVSPSHFV